MLKSGTGAPQKYHGGRLTHRGGGDKEVVQGLIDLVSDVIYALGCCFLPPATKTTRKEVRLLMGSGLGGTQVILFMP